MKKTIAQFAMVALVFAAACTKDNEAAPAEIENTAAQGKQKYTDVYLVNDTLYAAYRSGGRSFLDVYAAGKPDKIWNEEIGVMNPPVIRLIKTVEQ